MNTDDDMHRFLAVLMRYGIVFALIVSVLLLGLAALLIWKPAVLLAIFRYGIIAICIVVALWIIAALLVGVLKKRK